jgi:DNA-binding SARP family transcriptional activator
MAGMEGETLEFGLIGPFELRRGGRTVTLTARKQRALLAMLLLDAGRVVSWARLFDELWEGEPPRSALANLRTYAAQLRRVVFGGEDDRIVTEPEGYRVRLNGDVLDVAEFERWCAQVRQARLAGDLDAAVEAYDRVRDLWRGPPLSGLRAGPALAAAAVALEERYLTVTDDCFELRLTAARGRNELCELVAELRAYALAQPLREPAWRGLMLALYGCGDVPGALNAYRQAETVLRDELGLDPSPELRRLQGAMLRRDPGLALAPPPSPAGRVPVQIAVCGPESCTDSERKTAAELGRRLALRGAVVVCDAANGVAEDVLSAVRGEGGVAVSVSGSVVWSVDTVISIGPGPAAVDRHVMTAANPAEAVRLLFGDGR